MVREEGTLSLGLFVFWGSRLEFNSGSVLLFILERAFG